jgi:hypothetical protein
MPRNLKVFGSNIGAENGYPDSRLVYLLFCWQCITVYQHIETNVMHFIFSLLRIKVLYMFRALLAHPQEALPKRDVVHSNLGAAN